MLFRYLPSENGGANLNLLHSRMLYAKFVWKFQFYLPLEKGVILHLNKFETFLSKDALCQDWLKLAQRFWIRGKKDKSLRQRRQKRLRWAHMTCEPAYMLILCLKTANIPLKILIFCMSHIKIQFVKKTSQKMRFKVVRKCANDLTPSLMRSGMVNHWQAKRVL